VKSQVALGLLASMQSDRPARYDEALGWLLAAQENGGHTLDAQIARARDELRDGSDAETRRIVANYGLTAVRMNWLGDPSQAGYKICDPSPQGIAAGRKPPVDPGWRHAALGLIERTTAGRLVDVQIAFRYPQDTAQITEDYFVRAMLKNPAVIKTLFRTCSDLETLVVTANQPKTDKRRMLEAISGEAQKGNPEALRTVGMVLSVSTFDNGLAFILEAAQAGDAKSQHFIAKRFGRLPLGRKWLELSAQGNVPLAQIELAELLLVSEDRAAQLDRADELVRRASESEDQYVIARVAAIRAAAPDDRLRNSTLASQLTKQLDLEKWPLPIRLESAALSHAAAADFKLAIKLQKRAISKAQTLGYDLAGMSQRLAAFEAGRPWFGYLAAEYR
jgi:hypothetical protein